MGDYIPPEELDKFLAACNDAAAQKVAKEYAERTKIQADNVGHKLLSKMGWKEGKHAQMITIISINGETKILIFRESIHKNANMHWYR